MFEKCGRCLHTVKPMYLGDSKVCPKCGYVMGRIEMYFSGADFGSEMDDDVYDEEKKKWGF